MLTEQQSIKKIMGNQNLLEVSEKIPVKNYI